MQTTKTKLRNRNPSAKSAEKKPKDFYVLVENLPRQIGDIHTVMSYQESLVYLDSMIRFAQHNDLKKFEEFVKFKEFSEKDSVIKAISMMQNYLQEYKFDFEEFQSEKILRLYSECTEFCSTIYDVPMDFFKQNIPENLKCALAHAFNNILSYFGKSLRSEFFTDSVFSSVQLEYILTDDYTTKIQRRKLQHFRRIVKKETVEIQKYLYLDFDENFNYQNELHQEVHDMAIQVMSFETEILDEFNLYGRIMDDGMSMDNFFYPDFSHVSKTALAIYSENNRYLSEAGGNCGQDTLHLIYEITPTEIIQSDPLKYAEVQLFEKNLSDLFDLYNQL